MTFILQPWQLFFLVLSGWVNRHQQQMIDLYIAQTKMLLESQGKKRILLNDDHEISDQTVGKILKADGIEPAPER